MESLWRLAWAFPLVSVIGAGALLVLKRVLGDAGPKGVPAAQMTLHESLVLSEDTCLHRVYVGKTPILILESRRHASLHAVSDIPGDADGRRTGRATWHGKGPR